MCGVPFTHTVFRKSCSHTYPRHTRTTPRTPENTFCSEHVVVFTHIPTTHTHPDTHARTHAHTQTHTDTHTHTHTQVEGELSDTRIDEGEFVYAMAMDAANVYSLRVVPQSKAAPISRSARLQLKFPSPT